MSGFNQHDSLCAKPATEIAQYLREIGDDEAAERFARQGVSGMGLAAKVFNLDQYAYSGVVVGYIPPIQEANDPQQILPLDRVMADKALIGQRIKITIDQFFVQSYPGNGMHRILCEFSGKNQAAEEVEQLKFALTLSAADGQSAAILGTPIFVGLNVGQNGIAFEGRTVVVGSDIDDTILASLKDGAFQNGLSLLTNAQPALKPFVSLASSVVAATLSRKKNTQAYAFQLGLDFGVNRTAARLRLGSYIVLQAPSTPWNWEKFLWDTSSRTVVSRSDGKSLKLNYLVFGVSPFEA